MRGRMGGYGEKWGTGGVMGGTRCGEVLGSLWGVGEGGTGFSMGHGGGHRGLCGLWGGTGGARCGSMGSPPHSLPPPPPPADTR